MNTSAYLNSSSARGTIKYLRPGADYLKLVTAKPVTYYMGACLKFKTGTPNPTNGNPAGWWGLASTFASGSHYGPGMWFNGDGTISVGWRTTNTSGTTSGTAATSASFIPIDTVDRWYHTQMRMTMAADNTIQFEVIVDGTVRIALTAPWNGWANFFGDPVPYGLAAMDVMGIGFGVGDWWLADSSGTVNNGYLGNCRVESLNPTAIGSNSGMANFGGASSVASVSDAPNTTSYIRASAIGQKSTFHLSDLASTSGTVRGVSIGSVAIKESSTLRSYKNVLRTGGADFALAGSAPEPRLDLYRPIHSVLDVNPATGSPFTTAEINVMEVGVQLVT
jgi:hypothetical protein